MIKLEKEYIGVGEVKGYSFQLTDEAKNIGYIYMVSNDVEVHFEVFQHKETPLLIDFENRIYSETQTKVRYPKANDFGVWAWTYKRHKKAVEKLNELIENHKNKTHGRW